MRSSSVVCESIVCKSCEAKYCEHALAYIVFRKYLQSIGRALQSLNFSQKILEKWQDKKKSPTLAK